MKKQSIAFLLIVLSAGLFLPQRLYAQASTEGKEFWVALIPSRSPDSTDPKNESYFKPYIAISAPKACSVTLSNPNTNWTKTYTIANDNSWTEIKDIPLTQWFQNSIPSSEIAYENGIHVTATENVSVYCALWWSKSFDATNILPVTALQSDYIVTTYGPSNKDGVKQNVFTILAAEDCTVAITPSVTTQGNHPANVSFNVPLKAGQVYHVLSKENTSIAGSKVNANGKKIAVFAGCPLGNVPDVFADRDLLYEQLFPTDYWGTDFVVTRSLEKDANRILIIPQIDNTTVTIYGTHQSKSQTYTGSYELMLNAGDIYEFEMSKGMDEENKRWDSKRTATLNGITILDTAAYIHTSCPCAVISCDVGNGYKCKTSGDSEMAGSDGAPSMTWVSPAQQMLKDVVFGVMGTTHTHSHFVNIVVNTNAIDSVTLDGKDISSDFKQVSGNPNYSYARIKLDSTSSGQQNPTYHLHCNYGFIATVYGNGSDESYAYSAGSAAVQQGVNVNNITFIDGYQSDKKFCINDIVTFDAQVGTDDISRVDWDFGDGIVENESGVQTTHKYTSAGWYNVRANLYGHQVCTDVAEQYLGTVQFSIRVWKPQYIDGELEKRCLTLEEQKRNPDSCAQLLKENKIEKVPVTPGDCASDTIINIVSYKLETEYIYDQEGRDSALVNGKMYYSSETIKWTTENINGCDSFVTCNLTIITCLKMEIENDSANQVACWGEPLDIQYTKLKGEIDYKGEIGDKVQFVYTLNGEKKTVDVALSEGTKNVSGTITLPTEKLAPGVHHGKIQAKDYYCSDLTMEFPFDITISYPDNIMKPKFGNTIALYQKGKGGNKGWDLDKSTFVWYHDGDSVATGPVYYTPKDANGVSEKLNGEYYVAITTNGKTILSCPKTFENGKDVTKGSSTVAPTAAPEDDNTPDPAKKVLQNRQIFIVRDGQTFNIYGQKVQ